MNKTVRQDRSLRKSMGLELTSGREVVEGGRQ